MMKQLWIVIFLMIFLSCNTIDKKNIYENNINEIEKYVVNNPYLKLDKEPINSNYIKTDLEIIKEVINKLPYLKPTLKYFEKYCPGFQGWEYLPSQQMGQVDLGFGLTKSSDAFYGGYGSYYLEIINYNNDILYLELLLTFSSKNQYFIKNEIIDNIFFPIKCYDDNCIIYKKSYEENINNFQIQSQYKLSIGEKISENYDLEEIEMYEQLTNPTTWFLYDCGNRWCGCGGGEPYTDKARIAIDSLSKMKSYELIEKAVYCVNPIGRIYALEKLEKLEETQKIDIADSTKQIIDSIKELDIKIDLCNWCSVESYLGQYSYKEVKFKLDSINQLRENRILPPLRKEENE